MIDIHSHILPGLDDGAKTLKEAVEMLEIAARTGTTDIVATPHANLKYAFDTDLVKRKIAELRQACGGAVNIYSGCEFHLTVENIADALAHPTRYSIHHGRYLLIEFPDFAILRTMANILEHFLATDIIPVITHPERHPSFRKGFAQLRAWVEAGCLVQVTAQSLLGRFGSPACDVAKDLLRHNLVHFIASDAHDAKDRTPALDQAWQFVLRHYGDNRVRSLFIENPRAVLSSAPIDVLAAEPRPKCWWREIFGATLRG